MSKEQKITFYKFFSLYLVSSYLFLIIISFLYFETKSLLIHTEIHFNLHEKSIKVSNEINSLIQSGINDIDTLSKKLSLKEYQIEFLDKDMRTLDKNKKLYPKHMLNIKMKDMSHTCLVIKRHSIKKIHNMWGYILTNTSYETQIKGIKYNIGNLY